MNGNSAYDADACVWRVDNSIDLSTTSSIVHSAI